MVVRLRNGTHHEEVSKKMKELIVQVAHKREETDGAKEKEMEIPNRDKVPEEEWEVTVSSIATPTKSHEEAPKHFPKVLFPERLQKTKLVAQFQKFLEVIKNLHIKIPFADALEQMPNYLKTSCLRSGSLLRGRWWH